LAQVHFLLGEYSRAELILTSPHPPNKISFTNNGSRQLPDIDAENQDRAISEKFTTWEEVDNAMDEEEDGIVGSRGRKRRRVTRFQDERHEDTFDKGNKLRNDTFSSYRPTPSSLSVLFPPLGPLKTSPLGLESKMAGLSIGIGNKQEEVDKNAKLVDRNIACRLLAARCLAKQEKWEEAMIMVGISNPFKVGKGNSDSMGKSDGGIKVGSIRLYRIQLTTVSV
jgi:hypothetical protein